MEDSNDTAGVSPPEEEDLSFHETQEWSAPGWNVGRRQGKRGKRGKRDTRRDRRSKREKQRKQRKAPEANRPKTPSSAEESLEQVKLSAPGKDKTVAPAQERSLDGEVEGLCSAVGDDLSSAFETEVTGEDTVLSSTRGMRQKEAKKGTTADMDTESHSSFTGSKASADEGGDEFTAELGREKLTEKAVEFAKEAKKWAAAMKQMNAKAENLKQAMVGTDQEKAKRDAYVDEYKKKAIACERNARRAIAKYKEILSEIKKLPPEPKGNNLDVYGEDEDISKLDQEITQTIGAKVSGKNPAEPKKKFEEPQPKNVSDTLQKASVCDSPATVEHAKGASLADPAALTNVVKQNLNWGQTYQGYYPFRPRLLLRPGMDFGRLEYVPMAPEGYVPRPAASYMSPDQYLWPGGVFMPVEHGTKIRVPMSGEECSGNWGAPAIREDQFIRYGIPIQPEEYYARIRNYKPNAPLFPPCRPGIPELPEQDLHRRQYGPGASEPQFGPDKRTCPVFARSYPVVASHYPSKYGDRYGDDMDYYTPPSRKYSGTEQTAPRVRSRSPLISAAEDLTERTDIALKRARDAVEAARLLKDVTNEAYEGPSLLENNEESSSLYPPRHVRERVDRKQTDMSPRGAAGTSNKGYMEASDRKRLDSSDQRQTEILDRSQTGTPRYRQVDSLDEVQMYSSGRRQADMFDRKHGRRPSVTQDKRSLDTSGREASYKAGRRSPHITDGTTSDAHYRAPTDDTYRLRPSDTYDRERSERWPSGVSGRKPFEKSERRPLDELDRRKDVQSEKPLRRTGPSVNIPKAFLEKMRLAEGEDETTKTASEESLLRDRPKFVNVPSESSAKKPKMKRRGSVYVKGHLLPIEDDESEKSEKEKVTAKKQPTFVDVPSEPRPQKPRLKRRGSVYVKGHLLPTSDEDESDKDSSSLKPPIIITSNDTPGQKKELLSIRRIWNSDFRLSNVPEMSADQLFFVYYALDNCEASDTIYHKRMFESRFQLPAEDRVNFPLTQMEEFKTAFRCHGKSAMGFNSPCSVVQ